MSRAARPQRRIYNPGIRAFETGFPHCVHRDNDRGCVRGLERVSHVNDEVFGIDGVGVAADQELCLLAGMLVGRKVQRSRLKAFRIVKHAQIRKLTLQALHNRHRLVSAAAVCYGQGDMLQAFIAVHQRPNTCFDMPFFIQRWDDRQHSLCGRFPDKSTCVSFHYIAKHLGPRSICCPLESKKHSIFTMR